MKRALLLCGLILIIVAGPIFAMPYSHYPIYSNSNNAGSEDNYFGKRMDLDPGLMPQNISNYRPPVHPDFDSHQIPDNGINVVPEPGTMILLGLGALGLAFKRKLTR